MLLGDSPQSRLALFLHCYLRLPDIQLPAEHTLWVLHLLQGYWVFCKIYKEVFSSSVASTPEKNIEATSVAVGIGLYE